MKHTKRLNAGVGIVVWIIVLCVVTPLNTMISQKSTSKRIRMPQSTERYKNKLIWVKTSDNVRMELPEWQIDQMKAVQHKGVGTQYHWVDAPMITSDELALVQKALNFTNNLEDFRQFYANLPEDQKENLINSASKLEMQGLTSLLMTYKFPIDVQGTMGATIEQVAGLIAPVVDYLQKPEKIDLPHKGKIISVAFSPDGNRIISAAAGIDHNVILYDLKNRKVIKNLVTEAFPDPCVAFSPDGKYVVAGSRREFDTLILFDAITGKQIRIFGEGRLVNCVTFSADGNSILAGSWFGYYGYKPVLYDVKTGKIISTYKEIRIFSDRLKNSFEDYMYSMNSVAYRPNSSDMILGGVSIQGITGLNAYDCKTYKEIRSFVGLSQGTPCIAFSADGKYLVGGTLELILWDTETGKKIQSFVNSWGRISSIALHPSGNYVVVGFMNYQGLVVLFNCKTGKPIKKFDELSEARCVAFSPDGYSFLYGGAPGLMLCKLISKETVNTIATQLNIAQARLLYRLYLAKINNTPVILDVKDLDYQIFTTLPADVKQVVKTFLPFELSGDIVKNEIQQKMQELRSSLFYHTSRIWGIYEKKHDEKVKAVKDEMQKVEKNSAAYKACQQLLAELETEEAFK